MAIPFGRYQLLKKIASGGMGQVFLARTAGTQGFEKLIVIKTLLPHLADDHEFREMFFTEARIAARLNHPNLIQIFDLGQEGRSYFLAMEYVAGEDVRHLEQRARMESQSIPLGPASRIVADAAAGLDYAHRARTSQGEPLGLVHRDVSPQNILVGFDGAVKLIDFGVVKALDRLQHTATGILKGKYPYMSPEQASGEEVDHRSDVFSLGIIFWELLTGTRLFKGASDMISIRLVRECKVAPPSAVNAAIPQDLDALVLRALSRDPEGRYPDASAFRLAIEDFIVAQKPQASSAHLVAYMRGLYGERIARDADPTACDTLNSPDQLDTGDSTTGSKSESSSPRRATSPDRAVESTALIAPSRPPRISLTGRWGLAAILIAAAAISLLALRVGKARRAASFLEGGIQAGRDSDSRLDATEAGPAAVAITLASKPSGATVEVDGKKLGVTPLTFELGDAHAEALFSYPGFEPVQVTVTPDEAPLLTVQLIRKRAPKAKRNTNLGIKTGR